MRHRLGPFVVDLDREVVERDGAPVALPNREACLLFYLLRHAGRVIGKDELFEKVWVGRVVEDAALTRAISQLRIFLSDQQQKIIRTVPRRGYLLIVQPGQVLGETGAKSELTDAEAEVVRTDQSPGRVGQALESESAAKVAMLVPPLPRSQPWLMVFAALSMVSVLVWGFWPSAKPTPRQLDVRFPQASMVQSALLSANVARAAARFEPKLELAGPALRRADAKLVLISFVAGDDGSAVLTAKHDVREHRVVFVPGERTLVDALTEVLAPVAGQAPIAAEPSIADDGQAPNALIEAQMDHPKATRDLLEQLARGVAPATVQARLAYALSEQGEPFWPTILAADALHERTLLQGADACLADIAYIESRIASSADPLEKVVGTACPTAEARLAEARGDLAGALSALERTSNSSSILVGLKQLEVRARVTSANQPEAVRRLVFEDLIQMAQAAGWKYGLARIQEFRGDIQFGVESREQAIASYTAAASLYAEQPDELSAARVRASRALLLNRFDPEILADARHLVTLAESKGDSRSADIGKMVVLRYGQLPESEFRDQFNIFASRFLSRQQNFVDPLQIAKFTTLVGYLTEATFAIVPKLEAITRSYPKLNYWLNAEIAAFTAHEGDIASALVRYRRVESLEPLAKQLGFARTIFCVAGFSALEARDFKVAKRWFGKCDRNALPSKVRCVGQFAEIGRSLIDFAISKKSQSLSTHLRLFDKRDPQDSNCEAVALLLMSLAIRQGDLMLFEQLNRYLQQSPRIKNVAFEWLLVLADRCLVDSPKCDEQALQQALNDPLRSSVERHQLLAKQLQIHAPNCPSEQLREAESAARAAHERGAALLESRLRCAMAACAGQSSPEVCPYGRLGLYF